MLCTFGYKQRRAANSLIPGNVHDLHDNIWLLNCDDLAYEDLLVLYNDLTRLGRCIRKYVEVNMATKE